MKTPSVWLTPDNHIGIFDGDGTYFEHVDGFLLDGGTVKARRQQADDEEAAL